MQEYIQLQENKLTCTISMCADSDKHFSLYNMVWTEDFHTRTNIANLLNGIVHWLVKSYAHVHCICKRLCQNNFSKTVG